MKSTMTSTITNRTLAILALLFSSLFLFTASAYAAAGDTTDPGFVPASPVTMACHLSGGNSSQYTPCHATWTFTGYIPAFQSTGSGTTTFTESSTDIPGGYTLSDFDTIFINIACINSSNTIQRTQSAIFGRLTPSTTSSTPSPATISCASGYSFDHFELVEGGTTRGNWYPPGHSLRPSQLQATCGVLSVTGFRASYVSGYASATWDAPGATSGSIWSLSYGTNVVQSAGVVTAASTSGWWSIGPTTVSTIATSATLKYYNATGDVICQWSAAIDTTQSVAPGPTPVDNADHSSSNCSVSWNILSDVKCAFDWALHPSQTDVDGWHSRISSIEAHPPTNFMIGGYDLITQTLGNVDCQVTNTTGTNAQCPEGSSINHPIVPTTFDGPDPGNTTHVNFLSSASDMMQNNPWGHIVFTMLVFGVWGIFIIAAIQRIRHSLGGRE